MSAFDDEFGLFGDENAEDDERRSTLGARRIATGDETVIDEIEPEDERAPRRVRQERARGFGAPAGRRYAESKRPPSADEVVYPRAAGLLTLLAKKLVSRPEAVTVSMHPDARGAVLELEVHQEDLGKVIGRGGRIAHALRTLVRASAEGRVTIDIADAEKAELTDEKAGDDGEL